MNGCDGSFLAPFRDFPPKMAGGLGHFFGFLDQLFAREFDFFFAIQAAVNCCYGQVLPAD